MPKIRVNLDISILSKLGSVGLKHFKYLKAFFEHSNDTKDVYNNIQDYNLPKERKLLAVFGDMNHFMIGSNFFLSNSL